MSWLHYIKHCYTDISFLKKKGTTMVHSGMSKIKKHLCTFQRQHWLRLLEESLTVGERAKSEKPLVSAYVGQLNINKEKISSKKRWRKLNIREEQKGREGGRERERKGYALLPLVEQVRERGLQRLNQGCNKNSFWI